MPDPDQDQNLKVETQNKKQRSQRREQTREGKVESVPATDFVLVYDSMLAETEGKDHVGQAGPDGEDHEDPCEG